MSARVLKYAKVFKALLECAPLCGINRHDLNVIRILMEMHPVRNAKWPISTAIQILKKGMQLLYRVLPTGVWRRVIGPGASSREE